MIGLVLLLTAASITLTNGIPIEVNSPYLEFPEKYNENYKKPNYVNLPKISYELRPQLQSNSKRKNADYLGIVDHIEIEPALRGPTWTDGIPPPTDAGTTKLPILDDYIDSQGKRSFKSQELDQKLIALGLDYIEATNLIEALHRLQWKINYKNVQ